MAELSHAVAGSPSFGANDPQPPATFESLFASCAAAAFGVAMRLTRSQADAEDLVQDAALLAHRGFASFMPGTNFRAWLFRIAHNNFVNQRRALRHNRQPLVPEVAEDPRGPVAETLSREALRLIAEAVARLPSDFRGALSLRVEEGLSFRDIAEVMGITEETARWRVFKARQKLLHALAPQPDHPRP